MLRRVDTLLALEQLLAVLVEFKCGDFAVGGVDRDLGLLTVDLLLNHFVDVDTPSATVHRHDLAFTTLVSSTENLDRITLTDGDGARLVGLAEVLREMAREKLSSQGRGGGEVGLSGLSTLAGYTYGNRREKLPQLAQN